MIKKITIGILFLFTLCLGLFLLFASWLLTNPPELQSFITRQTGLIAEIKSLKLNLHAFHYLRLNAKGVTLYKHLNKPSIATIAQLSLVWNLRELLSGNVTIDTVSIERPQVEMRISQEGNILLGSWGIPWLSQDTSALGLFSLQVKEFSSSEGQVRLIFPEEWQMPPFQFTPIFARGKLKQGTIQFKTGFEWGGKEGTVAGNLKQSQGIWQGNYELSNFPLHVFTIPEIPKIFPSMPLDGNFNARGTISREMSGKLTSRLSWNIEKGRIINPKFTAGQMLIKTLKGEADFIADSEQGASLSLDVQEATIPPGSIAGEVHFLFSPDKPPVMTVAAHATNMDVNKTQSYIYGFMPDVASDWVQTHVYDGLINQMDFNLRWEITSQYQDINDILHLNLRGEVTGVNLDQSEGLPPIKNIHGYLHLGLWGLGIEADRGSFPGIKLSGGSFALGYGAPVTTPLKLEIYGQADGAEAWPVIRSLWQDSIPWLDQLSFNGNAEVKLLLEDSNILDEKPLIVEFRVRPQKVGLEWKMSEHTYRAQNVTGLFIANFDELEWENLQFTSTSLKGTMAGRYSFNPKELVEFRFHLDQLETLLPIHELKEHAWKPQQLSAEVTVRQTNREKPTALWQLDLTTTDERAQHLNLKMDWKGTDWSIQELTGKIGQIEASGSLDVSLQKGAFQAKIESPGESLDFKGTWQQNQANLVFKSKLFRWQDWQHWQLSPDFIALLPPSQKRIVAQDQPMPNGLFSQGIPPFPVKQWIVDVDIDSLYFSDKFVPKISFQSTIVLPSEGGPESLRLDLNLRDFSVGKQQARGSIRLEDEQLNLDIQSESIDPHFWIEMAQAAETDSAFQPATDLEFIKRIHLDLEVERLALSEKFKPKMTFRSLLHFPESGQSDLFKWEITHFQLPIFLDVPAVPNAFSTMPFKGQFNTAGEVNFTLAGQINSRLKWDITDGVLLNPEFPLEQMPVELKGNLELALFSEKESSLEINLTQALVPFGTLQGNIQVNALFDESPILTANLNAANWGVESAKPYLYGLMPEVAREWFRDHTAGGRIERADLDLRMALASNFSQVEEILALDLAIALSKFNVIPLEGLLVENVGGLLQLGRSGAELKIEQATFPGIELTEGKITLMYGKPAALPVKLDFSGKVNGTTVWPIVRSFFEEANPLLKQLSLQGNAEVSFLLEDKNLLDEEPFTLELKALPQNMEAEWQTPERTYSAKEIRGQVELTTADLNWQELHFKFGLLEGSAEGYYPFDQAALPRLRFKLQHLEDFFPEYADPRHPFAQWLPQKLSADVVVIPENPLRMTTAPSWQLEITTTDESERHLHLKVEGQESDWGIPQIEGQFGQITANGFFNYSQQESELRFEIGSSSQKTIALDLKWQQQSGFIALNAPSLRWQDWLDWKLPEPLKEYIPTSQSSEFFLEHLEMRFETLAMVFSPTLKLPLAFSGTLDLKEGYQLKIPHLMIAGQTGSFSYNGNLENGKIQFKWDHLDVSLIRNLQKHFEQDPFPFKPPEKNTVKTQPLFRELEIELEIDSFQFPGNEALPLRAQFHLRRNAPDFTLIFDDLIVGEQQATGNLVYSDDQHLDLQIQGKRIGLFPWLNLLRAWQAEPPFETTGQPSAIQTLHFDLEIENLYFNQALQLPVSIEASFNLPPPASNDLELSLDYFQISGLAGRGKMIQQADDAFLYLNFENFALSQSLEDFLKVSWTDGLNASLSSEVPASKTKWHFNIQAPSYPLHFSGTTQETDGASPKIDLHFETVVLPQLLEELMSVSWPNAATPAKDDSQKGGLNFNLTIPQYQLNVKGATQWETEKPLNLDLDFESIALPELLEDLLKVSWPSSTSEGNVAVQNGGLNFHIQMPMYDLNLSGSTDWNAQASPSLNLQFENIAPRPLMEDLLKVPWQSWWESTPQRNTVDQKGDLKFSIQAPQYQLDLEGTTQWEGNDYRVKIAQLAWERQHGTLQFNLNNDVLEVTGEFAYLDFKKWGDLQDEVEETLEESEAEQSSVATASTETDDPFTIRLPETNWAFDLQAKKFKFLLTDFEDFVFKGQLGPQKIQIPKLFWKKHGLTAFTLSGFLNRISQKNRDEERWEGAVSVDITDLGDMIEMTFGKDSQIAKQYPISGGKTHAQADIQLFPRENDLWEPHATISFHSTEGIVEKGESLVFLLATLSLQSYLKVFEEKLSGFEGKGLVYNSMEAKIMMKGGVFDLEDFIFASPNMRFVVSGQIDYEQDEQDLLICPQPFETLDLVLRNIPLLNLILVNKRGSFLEGCYLSSGPINDPTIIPLPQTILPGRIRDLFIFRPSDSDQEE